MLGGGGLVATRGWVDFPATVAGFSAGGAFFGGMAESSSSSSSLALKGGVSSPLSSCVLLLSCHHLHLLPR